MSIKSQLNTLPLGSLLAGCTTVGLATTCKQQVHSHQGFSTTYHEARQKFLATAEEAGAIVQSLPLTATGPEQQPLFIDIARLGSATPDKLIIHTSGIHGVEGFAGSAIQMALLQQPPKLDEDTSLLLVHPLNPYGVAWLRRYNESNVDLNRNYMLPGKSWTGTPETYHRLNTFLNPDRPPKQDCFLLQCIYYIARYGFANVKRAIASGQFDYPRGLFYGGAAIEESYSLYRDWLQQAFPSVNQVFVIDIHTGLGPFGEGSLFHMIINTPSDELETVLDRTFVEDFADSDVGGYNLSGPHSNLYLELYENAKVDFMTQEFGTYSNLQVLGKLRAENQQHHYGDAEINHWAKQNLKDAFCPDSDKWRQQVMDQGVSLVQAVGRYLNSTKEMG
jgi:hypothetical protein